MDRLTKKHYLLPLIPLRELVAFPSTIIPILVGREKSIVALKEAQKEYDGYIFLSVQKNQIREVPTSQEINSMGIIARIEKSAEQKNGSFRVVIQGVERARIEEFVKWDDYYLVKVGIVEDEISEGKDITQLAKNLVAVFEEYIRLKRVKLHGVVAKLQTNQLSEIADIIISVVNLPLNLKQSLLEEVNVYNRGVKILNILKKEVYILKTKSDKDPKANKEDLHENDIEEYRNRIQEAGLPDYVLKRAESELDRLAAMPPFSAESTVSRTYLDWLLAVPWNKSKKENKDIKLAAQILDEDHYGLTKVKDRILDYLAVRQMVKKPGGEILCFVGPPGVGKSSLSKSIARALEREFVRVSLGGVKDEAEIRGHRRTYIGSYPGQIVKGLKKAKYMNPLFLLDEIDKLSSDYRGDPASALLEALDPEQNSEFVDHYLDLEVDLSQIFFVTTANFSDPIPPALKDRMELIELPGYTEREKLEIAKKFLFKKQCEKNGLKQENVSISDQLILKVINEYTREAGVRNLERQIAKIMRKIVRGIVEKGEGDGTVEKVKLTKELLRKYLGIPKFSKLKIYDKSDTGVSVGLAWTATGGDILVVESRLVKGKGDLILTGRLGEIMKESSSTAFSYTKLKLFELDLDTEALKDYDIHLHIPEGAVPKEGPSAGVTLAVSMLSLLTGIPLKTDFAMTGEITLRGKILAVGGIKEKILAAHRYGIKNVIIPTENEKDYLEDIPADVQEDLNIFPIGNMDELLRLVLEKPVQLKNINSTIIRPYMNPNIQ